MIGKVKDRKVCPLKLLFGNSSNSCDVGIMHLIKPSDAKE